MNIFSRIIELGENQVLYFIVYDHAKKHYCLLVSTMILYH